MKGTLVSLDQCSPADYERLAKWLAAESSWYASGRPKLISAEDLRNENQHGDTHFMMVVENSSKRRVGVVTWTRKEEYEGSYSIGTGVGEKDQFNHGYAAEGGLLLLVYLFHAMNAHRVELLYGLYNKNVVPILAQWGVTVEGVLRDYFFLDGEYHDAVLCSILRDEFYRGIAAAGLSDMLDSIPRREKEEARALIGDLLAKIPGGRPADLVARPRPAGPVHHDTGQDRERAPERAAGAK
ncbi:MULTISPECIES: GNAT family N-acetyltransferase [Thermomonosporaceae]|uniref:GNAT family N-acetyltransferase n=1 Tax=Thermomonosporaceae TaxID=2012 RepID=UPI00255A82C7|nr:MULTISPECIES: GNAT family protein [Thermomonosporaceae]MDL4775344.1 GNAT family protein [Actinomadura xylanilytica]